MFLFVVHGNLRGLVFLPQKLTYKKGVADSNGQDGAGGKGRGGEIRAGLPIAQTCSLCICITDVRLIFQRAGLLSYNTIRAICITDATSTKYLRLL